jgi:hypothetical protein
MIVKYQLERKKDIEYVNTKFKNEGTGKVFVIEQDKYRHYVVADSILIQENDYDTLETSIPIKREKPLDEKGNLELYKKLTLLLKEKGPQYLNDLLQDTGNWKILE